MNNIKKGLLTKALLLAVLPLCAQNISGVQTDGSRKSNIVTAVPFLQITPDARTGAMGDAGVAVPGGMGNTSINAAKLVYLQEQSGVTVSYSPWLRKLVPDMNLAYLSGYYHLDDRNTVAASLRYFSLGNIQFTDANFQELSTFNPSELAFDISYARSFGPDFSLGGSVRYISSNLYSGQFSSGIKAQAGNALAADVSALYKTALNATAVWAFGLNLSNIGTKMGYSSKGGNLYFLPANFKLGTALSLDFKNGNSFIMALDFNKLMAPTQPVYDTDGNIIKGSDPNRSVPAGIIGSFIDATGGFTEELKEVSLGTGLEYSYQNLFALRAGYHYQSAEKGGSRYLTLGAGFRYNLFNIDFAYLAASQRQSPLANTLRFTLGINFSRNKRKTNQ
ncbi:type IX secretion system outer membrane channel protein PorV [Pedobacter fastidiosus]|uniref:Type IX secretion system outer membrane channel protein PorV n=1 Tax=Pedobacter fastidiosus TaxID=2765361 RepID=A0ABR7KTR3_9SPHI|nr:type IX secretion system outer membrane channel protein PorV [Pedobacter fastidiosus]MBC6111324.1 type IX secretion system outer membrane channel protein PorV [Pedobacter fastidiosus]